MQIIVNPEAFSTTDGVTLTHVNELCTEQSPGKTCATHYIQDIPLCVSI